MDQPENNNQETSWVMPNDLLCSYVSNYEQEFSIYNENKTITWFDMKMPFSESDREKQEQEMILKELVGMGIIKLQQPQQPKYTIPQYDGNKIPGTFIPQNLLENSEVKGQPLPPKQNFNLLGKKNKLGPNDLCHCGSGKKYKKCHGRS